MITSKRKTNGHLYLFTVKVMSTGKDVQAQGYDLWDVLHELKLDYMNEIVYKRKEMVK